MTAVSFDQCVDIGGGRGRLVPVAAASFARVDRRMMQVLGRPAQVTEAWRSPDAADRNYAAWLAYRNGTGPWAPYALPGWLSVHCAGKATDSNDWYNDAAAAVWRAGGWRQTARYSDDRDEPWHGEHFPELDTLTDDAAPASTTIQEDDMTAIAFARITREINTPFDRLVGPLRHIYLLPEHVTLLTRYQAGEPILADEMNVVTALLSMVSSDYASDQIAALQKKIDEYIAAAKSQTQR